VIIESENIGDITVVQIDGKLDVHSTPVFMEFAEKLMKDGRYKLVIDMKLTEFISSYGLGAFASILRNSQANGGNVALASLNPDIKTPFEVTGLLSKFGVFTGRDDAVKSFSK